jgi:hypothetical protein
MRNKFHLGLAAAAVLVSTLGIAVIGVSPAHAALSCTASGCNGKDPVAYGCAATAHTVNSTTWSDGAAGSLATQKVELRYSTKCKASWARVTATGTGTIHVTSTKAYMAPYTTSTGRTIYHSGSVYSKMRAGSAVSACGKTNFNNGAVIQTNCTGAG